MTATPSRIAAVIKYEVEGCSPDPLLTVPSPLAEDVCEAEEAEVRDEAEVVVVVSDMLGMRYILSWDCML